ncbi:MAG: FG-GAP repeat domain-containing protein [Planctomycetota bacterium]
MTRRRRGWSWVTLALALAARPARAEERAAFRVELDAPLVALRVEDADGDGVDDLVTLDAKRTLSVWRGRHEGGPVPTPTWRHTLDEGVAFVALEAGASPAGYVTLGTTGARRHGWDDPTPRPVEGASALTWSSQAGALLADLSLPEVGLLLPTPSGWRVERPGSEPWFVSARPARRVAPAGPFLEDRLTLTTAWSTPFLGRTPGDADGAALYWIEGTTLEARSPSGQPWSWDLGPLPIGTIRTLRDLDGDRRPEVIERAGTNQESHYALARPVVRDGKTALETLGGFRLAGFQLDPEWVDVNRDGRLDVVITTIPIHGSNILRTITAGRVTAWHNAYLQRAPGGPSAFPAEPDGVVPSDVEVNIRFTYAGTIEVERALTLVVDADGDGDGHVDLLCREGDAVLRWHRGSAAGVWTTEGQAVSIPPRGDSPDVPAYAGDLDGDGHDDVVLVYRAPPGGREVIVIVRLD